MIKNQIATIDPGKRNARVRVHGLKQKPGRFPNCSRFLRLENLSVYFQIRNHAFALF